MKNLLSNQTLDKSLPHSCVCWNRGYVGSSIGSKFVQFMKYVPEWSLKGCYLMILTELKDALYIIVGN